STTSITAWAKPSTRAPITLMGKSQGYSIRLWRVCASCWSAMAHHRIRRFLVERSEALEEHHDRIPQAAEEARHLGVLQGDHRVLAERLAVDRDGQRADLLAALQRRHQRLAALQADLDLV